MTWPLHIGACDLVDEASELELRVRGHLRHRLHLTERHMARLGLEEQRTSVLGESESARRVHHAVQMYEQVGRVCLRQFGCAFHTFLDHPLQ